MKSTARPRETITQSPDRSPDRPLNPEEALSKYLADCRARELSPMTIGTYRPLIRILVSHLPDVEMSAIAPGVIESAWWSIRDEGTRNPNTLRTLRVVFSIWLDWCIRNAGLPSHPMRKMPVPKKTAPRRPKVTRPRLNGLRAACQELPTVYLQVRARALLEVAWSALLRRTELMRLQLEHLRLDDSPPRIKIQCGKGGWSGWLPISDEAAAALRAWLTVRGEAPHAWLWCNLGEKRQRMSIPSLGKMLRILGAAAGIPQGECTPHAVRRGSATAMLQAGYDIGTVSAYLRHQNIQTTYGYVEANQSRLEEARNWSAALVKEPAAAVTPSAIAPLVGHAARGCMDPRRRPPAMLRSRLAPLAR